MIQSKFMNTFLSKIRTFIWDIKKNCLPLATILSSFCRIEEIDTKKQTVSVIYRGSKTIVKMSFDEAIGDEELIKQLSPQQACYLGGYFGRAFRASINGGKPLKQRKNTSFSLSDKQGRYVILFLNRNGDIGYYDKKTGQEIEEHPIKIANNKMIISRFDPSQACYIGIQAGLSMEKALSSGKLKGELQNLVKKRPNLHVVK